MPDIQKFAPDSRELLKSLVPFEQWHQRSDVYRLVETSVEPISFMV